MIGITQAQHNEAMDAAYALEEASKLITAAVAMLCTVPARFVGRMHDAMNGAEFDGELAGALMTLSQRISLDADNAAERVE